MKPSYVYLNSFSVLITSQCCSQAIVRLRTPRMYLRSEYFLVISNFKNVQKSCFVSNFHTFIVDHFNVDICSVNQNVQPNLANLWKSQHTVHCGQTESLAYEEKDLTCSPQRIFKKELPNKFWKSWLSCQILDMKVFSKEDGLRTRNMLYYWLLTINKRLH